MVKSLYIPAELSDEIQKNSFHIPSSVIGLFIKEILNRYGSAVQAILFYGSCLYSKDGLDGVVDLYVIVDSYRSAFKNTVLAALNWILPPNVFYIELCLNERKVRAKYAVLSIKDIEKGTSMHCFHSYFWGRFCQPVAMVYIGSEQAGAQVSRALANAVITFFTRTIPCIRQEFTVRELWTTGLGLSYAAELRPERPERPAWLWERGIDYFERITPLALNALVYKIIPGSNMDSYQAIIPARVRIFCRVGWKIRGLQGKILSVLRLIKASFTFRDGVDYILWKIRRHSGVTVEIGPFLRRHPIIAMCVLSWRIFRKGGVH